MSRAKGWSKERLAKFRATMAAKKAPDETPRMHSIPLDAIPARPSSKKARVEKRSAEGVSARQLALEIVRLLMRVLG